MGQKEGEKMSGGMRRDSGAADGNTEGRSPSSANDTKILLRPSARPRPPLPSNCVDILVCIHVRQASRPSVLSSLSRPQSSHNKPLHSCHCLDDDAGNGEGSFPLE